VGFVDDEPRQTDVVARAPWLGTIDDLPWILDAKPIDRMLVAFSARTDEDLVRVLRECDTHGVDVDVVPRLFDLIGRAPRAYALGGFPVLSVTGGRSSAAAAWAKRTLDIAASATGLLLVSPLIALVALLVLLHLGWPVFYLQERVGRGGRRFRIVKFRTLPRGVGEPACSPRAAVGEGSSSIAQAVDTLKREATCPTRVGRWLRVTSLDELPQLWNVLIGDMSLVGPRPLRPFEVDALDGWQRRRQSVRPGMTGLWQVLGRSAVPWDERMELDYSYVRHWSLGHDLRILAHTVGAVLSRRGAL
jgi:exopolysaccharide biosynthesis polyprenyl glycosylphosphotransferase